MLNETQHIQSLIRTVFIQYFISFSDVSKKEEKPCDLASHHCIELLNRRYHLRFRRKKGEKTFEKFSVLLKKRHLKWWLETKSLLFKFLAVTQLIHTCRKGKRIRTTIYE